MCRGRWRGLFPPFVGCRWSVPPARGGWPGWLSFSRICGPLMVLMSVCLPVLLLICIYGCLFNELYRSLCLFKVRATRVLTDLWLTLQVFQYWKPLVGVATGQGPTLSLLGVVSDWPWPLSSSLGPGYGLYLGATWLVDCSATYHACGGRCSLRPGLVWCSGGRLVGWLGLSPFNTHPFSNNMLCPLWILHCSPASHFHVVPVSRHRFVDLVPGRAACGLRIRVVAWSDRLEVQEPNGSASLCVVGETFTLLW